MKASGLAMLATIASTAAGSWIIHPTGQSDYTEMYQVLDQTVSPTASRVTGVWICTSKGFTGYCEHFALDFERCGVVEEPFSDKISSVGPNGGSECFFYSNKHCKETWKEVWGPVGYGGSSDLSSVDFNDKIRSYKCIPKSGID